MARATAAVHDFVIAGALAFARGVLELNNAGGDGAPPAPIDTRELRSSVRATVGSPSNESSGGGPYRVRRAGMINRAAQLGGFAVGDTFYLTWTAKHANIIEGGRRMGSHGRMLGSLQAPDGWVWPAVEVMLVRMDTWRHPQP
jgi:hypothetical protein